MRALARRIQQLSWRGISRLDALANQVYGWRYNPLYQSGTLVVLSLIIILVTGIYLLIFYRIGSPYESVARLTGQVWAGRWMRGLHRYASDLAVAAAAIHAFRIFAQRRSWGPRALAWMSGLSLLAVIFVCGWTGYVMVWDGQGQLLAVAGARLLDALPLFGEPIARTFVGEEPLPTAFFFLNLFAHIALPVGLGLLLWIHLARVARPVILPPKRLAWGVVIALLALAILWPVTLDPRANLFRIPGQVAVDAFFSFWLPAARVLSPGAAWGVICASAVLLLSAPLWTRPAPESETVASVVDERLCTGCEQCYLDCPYEAIAMLPRTDGRAELVARVDPGICVSCGICAGSCAPMGVGPAGRTGRDQLTLARTITESRVLAATDIVVIACDRSIGLLGDVLDGAYVHPVSCAGNLHTSIIEHFLKAGAGGALVVACPPRDCWNREGATWLEARMYEDREAELHERVDRRRVRLRYLTAGDRRRAIEEIRALREAIEAIRTGAATEVDLIRMCEPASERSTV